jgi:hypothetical protein
MGVFSTIKNLVFLAENIFMLVHISKSKGVLKLIFLYKKSLKDKDNIQ